MNSKSVDIVIPSFRLDERYLIPLIQLRKPEEWVFQYYLICDNPKVIVPPSIASLAATGEIKLDIHRENLGASASRNDGIEAGNGQWILFLDDDVTANDDLLFAYARSIEEKGNTEIGFLGLVLLPPALRNFSKALKIDPLMDGFGFAEKYSSSPWGVTANFLIKREAIGSIRFSEEYPKSGGGEDVAFFLQVRAANGFRNYQCVPDAICHHPWWNDEKPDYRRPFRYGIGSGVLIYSNQDYTFRDFLNTPETLFCLFIGLLISVFVVPQLVPLLIYITGWVIAVELLATWIKLLKDKKKITWYIFWHVVGIRQSYEWGRFWVTVSNLRIYDLGKRFDYGGKIGKMAFFKFNTKKIIKWILYFPFVYFLFTLLIESIT